MNFIKIKLSSSRVILLSFAGLIFLGGILLSLPISSASGKFTPFLNALFTSTSATCVTGLVTYDTASYWSIFGKLVIIILIQIGGMGVITVALLLSIIAGAKIGLSKRVLMQDSISAPKLGGIVRMTKFVIRSCIGIEFTGALIMMPAFIKDFGFVKGIVYAFFHSISAFCNAGFDLMGVKSQFSSLTYYKSSMSINIAIMLLIVLGGLGFQTYDDIKNKKFRFCDYSLQSKTVICGTMILIFLPAIYFYFAEFAYMGTKDRILSALFQSVTTRTAGFNTADMSLYSDNSKFITIILMLIGGSSGSTAGGMKITTLFVMFSTAIAVFRKNPESSMFKRRIDNNVVRSASALFLMYVSLFTIFAMIISAIENLPLLTCLFETASAVATVGLTLGITTKLHAISKILLIILMYFGRVGGLTVIFATVSASSMKNSHYPKAEINVG